MTDRPEGEPGPLISSRIQPGNDYEDTHPTKKLAKRPDSPSKPKKLGTFSLGWKEKQRNLYKRWVAQHLSSSEQLVWQMMMNDTKPGTATVDSSHLWIARRMRMGRPTVSVAIKKLEKLGLVKQTRKGGARQPKGKFGTAESRQSGEYLMLRIRVETWVQKDKLGKSLVL